jgi:ubiquinone biosynthesis protein
MQIVRPVVETVGGMGGRVRDLARLQQVVGVLVRHGLGILVAGVDLPGAGKPEPRFESTPERALSAIQELGPTFVKLGQVMSTRPDVIPDAYCAEFSRLQDDADPLPFSAVRPVLEAALGPAWREGVEFDDTPLATASIAQVHRATLPGGEQVVFKVQRPGVAKVIRADLNILEFLARRLLVEYPEARSFDPLGMVQEFERSISAELDFTLEATHMERFRENFRDDERVHIPVVYEAFTAGTVLCMEFLDGIKMRDARAAGCDMKTVGERYLSVAYDMLFVHGLFHGDLHPGNVIVLEDSKLGLLDFGMVGRMTAEMRTNVVAITSPCSAATTAPSPGSSTRSPSRMSGWTTRRWSATPSR